VIIDDDARQIRKRLAACQQRRLPDRSLVAFPIAYHNKDAPGTLFESQRQRHAGSHREAVSQRAGRCLDSRNQGTVGMPTQNAVVLLERTQDIRREKAFRSQDGIVGDRSVSFTQHEAIAILTARFLRIILHHTIVQDPEHIQRRMRAGIMLFVARRQCHQLPDAFKLYIHTCILSFQCPRHIAAHVSKLTTHDVSNAHAAIYDTPDAAHLKRAKVQSPLFSCTEYVQKTRAFPEPWN
jgi:hypothetical protein